MARMTRKSVAVKPMASGYDKAPMVKAKAKAPVAAKVTVVKPKVKQKVVR